MLPEVGRDSVVAPSPGTISFRNFPANCELGAATKIA
jgi:hypothetical protein